MYVITPLSPSLVVNFAFGKGVGSVSMSFHLPLLECRSVCGSSGSPSRESLRDSLKVRVNVSIPAVRASSAGVFVQLYIIAEFPVSHVPSSYFCWLLIQRDCCSITDVNVLLILSIHTIKTA